MSKDRILTVLLAVAIIALIAVLASPLGAAAFAPQPSWSQCVHPGF